jgi:sigma-54 specific flagellar transcriptional regulator A
MQDADNKSDSDHSVCSKTTSARRRKNKLLLDIHQHSLNELSGHIEQIAETDSNILLVGESSASNEIVSRAIHALSARSECLFNTIDCDQLSADALEAYLFGVEKGAFSTSTDMRVGQLESCCNGTVLLNNIGTLNAHMQKKLLHAIRTGVFHRVGGHGQIGLNVRMISSAQKNIAEQVETGAFNADLFKCLNQATISMPPLRRSSEDIPELVSVLTKNFKIAEGDGYMISEDAVRILSENSWSASPNELVSFLGNLSILYPSNGTGNKQHASVAHSQTSRQIPDQNAESSEFYRETSTGRFVDLPETGINIRERITEIEIQYIREALEISNGVVTKAAKLLGLRRTTLVEKLRKYGIGR